MGKKARSVRKDKRAKEKRNKKAANRAHYAMLRDQGINSKSKRSQRNAHGARKVRVFRVRERSRRMTDVEMTPKVHAEQWLHGVEPANQPIGAWIEARYMTWKQVHNTISVKKFLKLKR